MSCSERRWPLGSMLACGVGQAPEVIDSSASDSFEPFFCQQAIEAPGALTGLAPGSAGA